MTRSLVKPSGSIVKEHFIQTDRGEKKGSVIAATSKYTFLLTDSELLKIDNKGNKVVRVTRFSSKEKTPTSHQQ